MSPIALSTLRRPPARISRGSASWLPKGQKAVALNLQVVNPINAFRPNRIRIGKEIITYRSGLWARISPNKRRWPRQCRC